MNPLIVSAAQVGKTFRVYERPWHRLLELVSRRSWHRSFEALQDVGFEIRRGESLGVIGENGAGKSTLLRILSGVTTPTRGEVAVHGRIASLLELGMGFHPEFTGRQNIRLNAAIMGQSEQEVERRIPEILEFSELGEFIDRPVKTYSTGMAMRLGFSIAVHADPEVLIVDEALSVGDGYFQKKCMDRLLRFVASGRTLLFCSHSLYYVTAFCQRALWLRRGRVAALGPVDEVVREYENYLLRKSEGLRSAPADRSGEAAKPARIVAVRPLGGEGEAAAFQHRKPWILEIEWETTDRERPYHVAVGVDRVDGVQICSFATHRDRLPPLVGEERYTVRLLVPELPMLKGEFSLYVYLLDERGLHVYDQTVVHPAFSVAQTPDYHFGLIQVEHSWDLECGQPAASPKRGI